VPIVTGLSDYKTNNDNSGRDNKGEGKDSDSGDNRRVIFRDFKIERHIIEERLNN
jgi:hypothetical protein